LPFSVGGSFSTFEREREYFKSGNPGFKTPQVQNDLTMNMHGI
jgi:hypothetical protein